MTKLIKPVLLEILDVINGVETATRTKSFDDFKEDWVLRLAIQRALEIVSEASRRIPDELLAAQPEIPWRQIRGIGNILRHEYHKIADDIVWSVIVTNFPPLRAACTSMLLRISDHEE